MFSRRFILGAIPALSLMATGVSHAIEKTDDGYVIVVGSRQPVSTLDPSVKYDASIRTMLQGVYDALVKYEGNPPKVVPWLAESWDVSEDGKVWTFELNQDARFHNGDPVDAEAVRFSFERTLGLNKGPAWTLNEFLSPDNVKVVGPHTIEFTLDKPFAPFLGFLPWWYIMNPKQVMENEVDDDWGQAWLAENEAGSGPYELSRFEQGELYQLDRVKDYWRGFPYPEEAAPAGIIYRMIRETAAQRAGLITGETDIVLNLSPDEFDVAEKTKGVETSTEPALTAFGIKFNTRGEYTSDKNLRRAIAHAFDYDGLIKIYNGKAVLQTSPFAHGVNHRIDVSDMPRRDLEKARDFLAKSKWPEGGIELEFGHVQGNEEQRLMALLLINSLQELNIKVNAVPLTWPNLIGRGSKPETAPDMMAIFATPLSTDPDAVAFQYHPSSWGKYYGTHFYDNPEVKMLIEMARFESDPDHRAVLYAEIQEKIVEDQPEIFGMMRERRIAYRDYIGGFSYSPVRMTSEVDLYPLHIKK